VLRIERLFHFVSLTLDQNVWLHVQLSRGGPKIST